MNEPKKRRREKYVWMYPNNIVLPVEEQFVNGEWMTLPPPLDSDEARLCVELESGGFAEIPR